jgi:hypothetical protein
MNTDSPGGADRERLAERADDALRSALMVCEVCDLVGGPFAPAEAAHLRAIHDRLHHGVPVAA